VHRDRDHGVVGGQHQVGHAAVVVGRVARKHDQTLGVVAAGGADGGKGRRVQAVDDLVVLGLAPPVVALSLPPAVYLGSFMTSKITWLSYFWKRAAICARSS
jgi:hypothetical protein